MGIGTSIYILNHIPSVNRTPESNIMLLTLIFKVYLFSVFMDLSGKSKPLSEPLCQVPNPLGASSGNLCMPSSPAGGSSRSRNGSRDNPCHVGEEEIKGVAGLSKWVCRLRIPWGGST